MTRALTERGSSAAPRRSTMRTRGGPSRPAVIASATTRSPSAASPASPAGTRYSLRSRRSAGINRPSPRPRRKRPTIRPLSGSSGRSMCASIAPPSHSTRRAKARAPGARGSAPAGSISRIAGAAAGQSSGRTSGKPSSSLPTRSTVTSRPDDRPATKRRLPARATMPPFSAARNSSPSARRSPAPSPKARASSRRPTAAGCARRKARRSPAEGRPGRLRRGSPGTRLRCGGEARITERPRSGRGCRSPGGPSAFCRCCRPPRPRGPSGAALALPAQQRDRLRERQRLRLGRPRQRGDRAAMREVGPVAAAIDRDGAAVRMFAQGLERLRSRTTPSRLFGQQCHRPVEADRQHIIVSAQRAEGIAVLDIGAETADAGDDRPARIGVPAELARQREQAQRAIEVDLGGAHAARKGNPFRLVLACGDAELDIMAVGALFQHDREAACRVGTERPFGGGLLAVERERTGIPAVRIIRAADERPELAELEAEPPGAADRTKARIPAAAVRGKEMGSEFGIEGVEHLADRQLLGAFHRRRKIAPEPAQHLFPINAPAGDLVELVFEIGGEAVLHVALEEAGEKGGDEAAAVLGDKAPLVEPDILAILQDLQDRGIGRGPPDAELFKLLDEARLGITRRRLREVLPGDDRRTAQPLALPHRRQTHAFALFLAGIVAVLLIKREKAVEGYDRAGRPQPHPAVGVGDVDGELIEHRRGHLTGHRAPPDQFVKALMIAVEMAGDGGRPARNIGRPDRLMRLLRVLGRALIETRLGRQVLRPELVADQPARRGDRFAGDGDAVGAHIGDQSDRLAAEGEALIEALRDLHRAGGGKPELARGLLLQGRGGERRKRVAADLAALDRGDRETGRGEDRRRRFPRLFFAVEIEAVEPLAVEMGQAGGKALTGGGLKFGLDRPVLARAKGLDLGLALANQTQRHRLDAAGRAASRQLAP